MKLLKGKQKGFTLIELLVVMAIIGILVGIGVPRFMTMTESSKVATMEANHRMYVSFMAMYSAEHAGDFPKNILHLNKYVTGGENNITTVAMTTPKGAVYAIDPSNHKLTATLSGLTQSVYKVDSVTGATAGQKIFQFTP